ncbi:hypothetical protein B0H34DRAFT_703374 [Crassisporium funariophilum]|nr:hypothetical protein B0H34DRAFT_703374 [Crassisporium funariophilum]
MSPSFLISLILAASAIAAPQISPANVPAPGKRTCDVSKMTMALPAGQTVLSVPTLPPSSVLLGVGVQNYTCSTAGTFSATGAVAELYDISCLCKTSMFNNIQDMAYAIWQTAPASAKVPNLSSLKVPVMGQHFFVTSPSGTGISPVWDFRAGAAKGNSDAFVLAAKVANLPAPTGPKDVDWLELKSVQGALAAQVYRTDTRGGPAPTSCTPGATISVKYTSKYWFFGGTVKV